MPRNTVYVGRPTMWGNPFRVEDCLKSFENYADPRRLAHQAAVDMYREWLDSPAGSEIKIQIRAKLRGKNLACWCKPGLLCHADVLLEIANEKLPQRHRDTE